MKKITDCFLLIIAFVLFTIPAVAERDPLVADFWRFLSVNAARPELVDRWTNPEANSGFAFSPEEDLLEIVFPKMLNRDATVFLYRGECWLLDCSDDWEIERITSVLEALKVEKIDRVINTHPHPDHLDGLPLIHQAYPVGELMIAFPANTTECGNEAVKFARENGIRVTMLHDEDVLTMGDGMVRFQCWMKADPEETLNDRSAQFLVTYGERSIYFAADIGKRGQRQMLEKLSAEALKADVLRFPHHGKIAMDDDFYNAVDPRIIIITNSLKAAGFEEGMRYAEAKKIPVVYTTSGHLKLSTDGLTWLCEKVEIIDQSNKNSK